MIDDRIPTTLEQPVWYEPLRSPAWLVPPVEADAPLVAVSGAPAPEDPEDRRDRELREGLPLALAEALRFTTAARIMAVVGAEEAVRDVAVRARIALEGGDADRAVVVGLEGPGGPLGQVREAAVGDAGLERALGSIPNAVTAALRPAGVRSIWSTVYQPPPPGTGADLVRAHALCRRMRDPRSHRDVSGDTDATAARRAAVDDALRRLADLSGRVTSPLASMPFFAALAAAHAAGNGAYLGFRLSANGRCTNATDPRDPVFRVSVLVFRLLGDPVIAGQRTRALATVDDPELRRWLDRVAAVEALR